MSGVVYAVVAIIGCLVLVLGCTCWLVVYAVVAIIGCLVLVLGCTCWLWLPLFAVILHDRSGERMGDGYESREGEGR